MQLTDLTAVLTAEGPFVTVHVGAESAVEQAADRYELAWRNVVKRLEDAGVAAPVREAVSAARGDHADGAARLVVASTSTGEVLLAEPVSSPPATDLVEVGPLPRLLPLVSDVSARVPHVVVRVDREGADVSAFADLDDPARSATVKGRTLHLTKVGGGGWSHLRYQHRAENQWKENAGAVAETVAVLAEHVGAALVIGVGDARELGYVEQGLPHQWRERWTVVEGGRGHDGSESAVEQHVRDVVARHVATGTLDLLEQFAQERGQDKRACDGVTDVVAALRKAQVETLLVTTGADQAATLFYGDEPAVVGETADEVTALGGTAHEGPLVEVLVRAALGTGADVQVVPHEPQDAPSGGVGAVLRYADAG